MNLLVTSRRVVLETSFYHPPLPPRESVHNHTNQQWWWWWWWYICLHLVFPLSYKFSHPHLSQVTFFLTLSLCGSLTSPFLRMETRNHLSNAFHNIFTNRSPTSIYHIPQQIQNYFRSSYISYCCNTTLGGLLIDQILPNFSSSCHPLKIPHKTLAARRGKIYTYTYYHMFPTPSCCL